MFLNISLKKIGTYILIGIICLLGTMLIAEKIRSKWYASKSLAAVVKMQREKLLSQGFVEAEKKKKIKTSDLPIYIPEEVRKEIKESEADVTTIIMPESDVIFIETPGDYKLIGSIIEVQAADGSSFWRPDLLLKNLESGKEIPIPMSKFEVTVKKIKAERKRSLFELHGGLGFSGDLFAEVGLTYYPHRSFWGIRGYYRKYFFEQSLWIERSSTDEIGLMAVLRI